MAKIFPFRAVYYDPKSISDLSDVVTPPYDTIGADEKRILLERHPYNFAHILLPKSENETYLDSAAMLKRWRTQGILQQDTQSHLYLYQQQFSVKGVSHNRNTLICSVLLTDFQDRVVRPHEQTHGAPKEDRIKILRQTRYNLSPVFGMVEDGEGQLQGYYEESVFHPAFITAVTKDGIRHGLWKIENSVAEKIQTFFSDKPLYIVDGHHRYEVALGFAKELGAYGKQDQTASMLLFGIANSFDPALLIFPLHRIVRGIQFDRTAEADFDRFFEVKPTHLDELHNFCQRPTPSPQFILGIRDKLLLCIPKDWQRASDSMGVPIHQLSVAWSDELFLAEILKLSESQRDDKIVYEQDWEKAWAQRRSANLIIFLPPLSSGDVTRTADASKFLPQKSTYFYPKLPAGFLMRDLGTG